MSEAWVDRIKVHHDGSFETDCVFCNEHLLVFPSDAVGVVFGPDGEIAGMQCQACAKMTDEEKDDHFRKSGML